MSMPIPPRPSTLDPDAIAGPTLGIGKPWWAELRPWPPDVRFDDVDPVVLDLERLADAGRLSPPPTVGHYTCAARICSEAPLAGLDADLEGPRPLLGMLRRRVHPADRRVAGVPA